VYLFYYCAVRPSFQEGREKVSVGEVVEYGEKIGRNENVYVDRKHREELENKRGKNKTKGNVT
jgi:hypothetical protein